MKNDTRVDFVLCKVEVAVLIRFCLVDGARVQLEGGVGHGDQFYHFDHEDGHGHELDHDGEQSSEFRPECVTAFVIDRHWVAESVPRQQNIDQSSHTDLF